MEGGRCERSVQVSGLLINKVEQNLTGRFELLLLAHKSAEVTIVSSETVRVVFAMSVTGVTPTWHGGLQLRSELLSAKHDIKHNAKPVS